MTLTGYSVPTTLLDLQGRLLTGRELAVTGPNGYVGTVTTDAATARFRLGPLPIGDYTIAVEIGGILRTGVAPVFPSADQYDQLGGGTIKPAGGWLVTDLSTAVQTSLAKADAAETPAGAQTKATTAQTNAIAASEPRISRAGALAGYVATLGANGTTVYSPAPSGGTPVSDASTTVKGVVQLAVDGGTTAGTAVQASDSRLVAIWEELLVGAAGTLTAPQSQLPEGFPIRTARKLTYFEPRLGTAPTGSAVTVRATRFASGASSGDVVATASIAAGAKTGAASLGAGVALAAGDSLYIDITAVGSTTAGADLSVAFGGTR